MYSGHAYGVTCQVSLAINEFITSMLPTVGAPATEIAPSPPATMMSDPDLPLDPAVHQVKFMKLNQSADKSTGEFLPNMLSCKEHCANTYNYATWPFCYRVIQGAAPSAANSCCLERHIHHTHFSSSDSAHTSFDTTPSIVPNRRYCTSNALQWGIADLRCFGH